MDCSPPGSSVHEIFQAILLDNAKLFSRVIVLVYISPTVYEFLILQITANTWHCLTFCCCAVAKPWFFATPWTAAHQASLSFTIFLSVLKLMSSESVMLSNHLILCCSLLCLFHFCQSVHGAKMLSHCGFFFFWLCCMAYGTLLPWPGTEPTLPELEAQP